MDRVQIIVVAKNITVLQLFISRMAKMCAVPQLVSAPLILYQLENISGGATHNVSTVTEDTYI